MDVMKIGAFIKSQRTELNLTQKDLAEKIGCTDKAISRWETGKGMPDSSFLVPLADILGVTVSNDYGMNGKYYEIGVGTIDTTTGENCTCFGVYIER